MELGSDAGAGTSPEQFFAAGYSAGMDLAAVQALLATAHELCPYSNATRGHIDVSLTVVGAHPAVTGPKDICHERVTPHL